MVPTDVNIAPDGLDTNWETSWSVFDANMKATYALILHDHNALYVLKSDANLLYALKGDVNVWINQLNKIQETDSNKWVLTKLDGNALYSLKGDVNTWIDQKLVPYLSKTDANGFYPLKADVNTWAGEKDRLMQVDSNKWTLTKLDANGFYALKSDVNTWGDQRYLKLTGGDITGSIHATQDINAKVLKADKNIYIGTNVYMYDDGTALIIGRT